MSRVDERREVERDGAARREREDVESRRAAGRAFATLVDRRLEVARRAGAPAPGPSGAPARSLLASRQDGSRLLPGRSRAPARGRDLADASGREPRLPDTSALRTARLPPRARSSRERDAAEGGGPSQPASGPGASSGPVEGAALAAGMLVGQLPPPAGVVSSAGPGAASAVAGHAAELCALAREIARATAAVLGPDRDGALRLELDGGSLGPVRVEVRARARKVSCAFVCAGLAARRALCGARAELADALAARGLELSGLRVSGT
jgi:hypothetical protein